MAQTDGAKIVAANVIDLRRRKGWSLDDLAARMSEIEYPMARSTINKIENNARDGVGRNKKPIDRRKVTVDDVLALARAFEVSPDELLTSADGVAARDVVALLEKWSQLEQQARSDDLVAAMSSEQASYSRFELAEFTEELRRELSNSPYTLDQLDEQIRLRFSPDQAQLLRQLYWEEIEE